MERKGISRTLNTKAAVPMKMDRIEEAKKIVEEAVPMGTAQAVHFYGRTLLSDKQMRKL